MTILRYQFSLHEAAQPGGPLEMMKWHSFSITNHDFLLAAMILCLDIKNNQRDDPGNAKKSYCSVAEAAKLEALERSRNIWLEIVDECRDARRAINILTSVLERLTAQVEEHTRLHPDMQLNDEPLRHPKVAVPGNGTAVDSWQTNLLPADLLEIPLVVPTPTMDFVQDDMFSSGQMFGPFGSDLDIPADFNWVCILLFFFFF